MKTKINSGKKIIAVDLFCGAGGLTRGLLDAGIKVKKGYDIELNLKKTYEKNNKGTIFHEADVSNLTGKQILEGIDRKNNFFLLAGCAPCQPFSRINKKKFNRDKRKFLIMQFGRLVVETKPDFIILENVPGLKRRKGKYFYNEFIRILKKEGYFFDSDIINVKDYGVPQNRERLILIASLHAPIEIPDSTHGAGKKSYKTVRQAIAKYPVIRCGIIHKKIPNHQTRDLDLINKQRLRFIKKDGGSRSDLPRRLVLKCHKNHNGHSDVYGRMRWDYVAPTLTCKCTSISNGRFGHPSQLRGISVREAATLQTFKDRYVFYGFLNETTRWVGNAVPVKFSQIVGKKILSHAGVV